MDRALRQCIRRTLVTSRTRINQDLDDLQRTLEALAMVIYARDFDHLDAMAKGETGLSEEIAALIEIYDFRDVLDEAESAVDGLMGDLKKGSDRALRAWIRNLQERNDPAKLVSKARNVLRSCEESREARRAAGEDLPALRHPIAIACEVRDGVELAHHELAVREMSS